MCVAGAIYSLYSFVTTHNLGRIISFILMLSISFFAVRRVHAEIKVYRDSYDFRCLRLKLLAKLESLPKDGNIYTAQDSNGAHSIKVIKVYSKSLGVRYGVILTENSHETGVAGVISQYSQRKVFQFWTHRPVVPKDHDDFFIRNIHDKSAVAHRLPRPGRWYFPKFRDRIGTELRYATLDDLRDVQTALSSWTYESKK